MADDGYIATSGAAINYGHSKQVQMVSERVVIKLRDRDSAVDATFHFKNLGGPVTVTMGFPETSDRGRQSMHDFRSEVDGKRAVVTRKFLEGGYEDVNHKAVWLKRVSFGAGQSRTVHVSYRSDNGFSFTGSAWHEYVLSTGATWAKRIETCELVVDGSRLRREREFIPTFDKFVDYDDQNPNAPFHPATTKWTSIGPHRVSATLKEIKPDFDLRIELPGGFYKFKVDGRAVPFEYFSVWSSPIWPRMMNREVWVSPEYEALGAIFGADDSKRNDKVYGTFAYWSNPAVPGRQVKKNGEQDAVELKLNNGRTVRVPVKKHVWLHEYGENEYMDMVPLGSVVHALGGTMTFDKKSGYVLINFPKR